MLDDAASPNTPDWWLLRLGERLQTERKRFDRLDNYHRGNHPVPYGNRKMREAYRRLQKQARTNYSGLVAETLLERMKVVGFRAGGGESEDTDSAAWQWWQANKMDANSGLVHRAAVVMSRAYVIVGDRDGKPLVTGEDPRQVIHESDPSDRYALRAALKVWADDVEQAVLAVLYLPDTIHYYRARSDVKSTASLWKPTVWEVDTSNAFAPNGSAVNPFGVPPVVPFLNRPDLTGNGLGEFEDVLDIQDRINTVVLDRLVISAMQAYRQRWVKGIDLEDKNGNPQTSFDPGADLLWAVPDQKAEFGEFGAVDLAPLIAAIESDVSHLAACTRCPPQYLLGSVINVSGDALTASETGLVAKTREREQEYGESWEAVYRLAGIVMGRTIPDDAEVLWRDPQFRSLTEVASASVQLKTAGVPWRTRMAMLDKTPQEIERMDAERHADAVIAALAAPPPPLALPAAPTAPVDDTTAPEPASV